METQLKVMEALQEEAYKGIVRIDSETMHLIGVHAGDIVEIEGERTTVGIVDRAYPTDVGSQVIRMDGILRRNAKTSIGEAVKVRKAEVKEAKTLIIAPAQTGITVQANPELFKRGLLGRAVTKGDIVALGGTRRRRKTMSDSPFFDDIFNVFENDFMGSFGLGSLKFVVVDSNPKAAVVITENTELTLSPKAQEIIEEKIPDVTYEDLGGLEEEVKKIREMVELPLKHPEIFSRLGIEPPAGVLLHGPPGTGKTLLAKAVANESDANFILINGPEIMNKFYGECVADDSVVFTNGIGTSTIEKAVKSNEVHKIAALSFKDMKIKMLPVSDKFDKGIQDTLAIKTRYGEIKATPTSKLFTLKNNKSEWSFVQDLKEKDIVAMTKQNIPEKDLEKLNIKGDIVWTSIEEIKKGKSHVYDFTVPKDHNFIANGFIVHNSEKRVRQIFEDAEKSAPSIIFIDEIDAIAPKREETRGEVERRVVAQLLTMMDGLKARKNVVVIAATNRPNSVDPALRRPGRFDREISIRVPDKKGRLEVLKIHTRNMPLTEDVKLEKISEVTHGFVGADLSALCKEAAMSVLRRILPELKLNEKTKISDEVLEKLRVTDEDFKSALKIVRPSAIREVLVESPNVKWTDIGGLEDLKEELKEAVEWPLKHADAFKRMGIRPARGILMYGPPGTGKTLLAKAVASEAEANFIQVKGPALINMWVGESERGIRQIFEKARQVSPCIVFFDEIDSIAQRRGTETGNKVTERVVNTLLAEMDGLQELNDVVVIAATNRPDMVDPALMRPGRFDRIINTKIPDKKSRLDVFKIHTKGMPLTKDVKLDKMAELTENYVGADIEAVCREAAMLSLRENIKAKEVTMKHFEEALNRIKPSIFEEDLKRYQEIEEEYIRKAKAGQLKKEKQVYFG